MKLKFSDILGRHSGRPAVCVGHGPSLNNYTDKIGFLKQSGHVIIGCNEWYHIYSECPDYWVLANNIQRISTDAPIMNLYVGKTTIVYADSVDWTNRDWVRDNLMCDYLPYDQWHFGGQSCGNPACHHPHLIKDRLTIQEELQKYCNSERHYGGGDTVMVHCLATAILLGCNPIYVIGVDLDYHKGYAHNKDNLIAKVNVSELTNFHDQIVEDFKTIVSSAVLKGVKILCPVEDLCFGVFEKGTLV